MSTIKQDISNLRNLIKQVQNDTQYEDQFLYSLLMTAAAKLHSQVKEKNTSSFQWTTFCIPLETAKSHDCDCVPVGCDVLKSIYEIPRPLNNNQRLYFKVETLGDTLISPKSPQEVKTDNLDDIKSGKLGWYIRNSKLIIWNNLDLKAVQVTGLWEDITEWSGKELCDETGTTIVCEDILDNPSIIEPKQRYDVYNMVLGLLNIPLQIREDMSVDAQPEIK